MLISDWSSDLCSSDLMPGLALEPQLHRTDPAMRAHRFAVGRFGDDHARNTVLTLEEGFDAARIVGLLVAAEQERGVPARALRGSPPARPPPLALSRAHSARAVGGAAPAGRPGPPRRPPTTWKQGDR